MLGKMKSLMSTIAGELIKATNCEPLLRRQGKSKLRILNAQFTISGPDGKIMYFKHREGSNTHSRKPVCSSVTPSTQEAVPAEPASPSPLFEPVRLTSLAHGLGQRIWPPWQLLGDQKVHGKRVIIRSQWLQSQISSIPSPPNDDDFEISFYDPSNSRSSVVRLQRRLLSLTRRHRSRQSNDAPATYSPVDNIRDALRCCFWKDDCGLGVKFPILHREARILSYLTYASIPALISVRVELDLSCKIAVVDARTIEERTLILPEAQVSAVLGARLLEAVGKSLDEAFRSICRKLFVEYTTRGLEVLFPGVKARGALRRHPAEMAVLQRMQEQDSEEREAARKHMHVCALQTAANGKREAKKRQRWREEAARRLQWKARRLIRRRQAQRAISVQTAAAVIIQRRIRRTLALRSVERRRQVRRHDLEGSSFRLACKISKTFALVNVRVVTTAGCEPRGTATIDEIRVSLCHPVRADVAPISVSRDCIGRIMAATSASLGLRELVNLIVQQHLDVFRSAQHNLLVVALRYPR